MSGREPADANGRVVATSGALIVALLGCASPGPPATSTSIPAAATGAPSAELHQGLFRIRYRGADGRGRVRLTLRSADEGHFFLQAVDSFGRRLWSFQSDGDSSLLLDHRASEYCRLVGDIVVRALALSELPVAMLPRVLFGELPSPPAAGTFLPSEGEVEFVGRDGRQWSARLEAGTVASWTLWQDGAPLVWWRRDGTGGILSHREGAQALWTTAAEEHLEGVIETLQVPADYSVGGCDAQDVS